MGEFRQYNAGGGDGHCRRCAGWRHLERDLGRGFIWCIFGAGVLQFRAGNRCGALGRGGFGGTDLSAAGLAAKTVSHGLIGGAIADLQGGRFGHGFLSSGVTAASSPYIAGGFGGNRFAQGALASIIGGTVSKSTGGRFANGAVTAAMAFAFNQLPSERGKNEITSEQFELGVELEVNPAAIAKLRGGKLGRILEVLGADLTLSSDGRLTLGASLPEGGGVELVYDGQGSFNLSSPIGSVGLSRQDADTLFGPNPPFGPGWEAGFTSQLNPKFSLNGNLVFASIKFTTTINLTPQQNAALRNRDWWLQNLTGGAPIGMTPDGN